MKRTVLLFLLQSIGCAAISHASTPCAPEGALGSPVEYQVGGSPFAVATADLNGDGFADVVTVNNSGFDVSVLLGNGTGGFAVPRHFPVTSGIGTVDIADLNGDGTTDLVVGQGGSHFVHVLYGDGAGNFGPAVSHEAGSNPYGVVLGDFNEDGQPDLAATNYLGGGVSVMIGQAPSLGDLHAFGPPVLYPTAANPYSIISGDWNLDGIADLASTNEGSGSVTILIGRGSGGIGDGRFTVGSSYPTGTYAYGLTSADFNSDGVPDLAVANGGGSSISVLLGAGTGHFAAAVDYPYSFQPRFVTHADFNSDGIEDLAASDYYGSLVLLPGQGTVGVGTGAFGPYVAFPKIATCAGIASDDFNEDGSPDVVLCHYGSSTMSVFLNQCAAAGPPPNPAPVLRTVRDVPSDQGGRVVLEWERSELDVLGRRDIVGYRVWRRVPAPRAGLSAASHPDGLRGIIAADGTITYWEAIASLPAERLAGYGYLAPTTQDSTRQGNPYTAFFVTALTADPFVFFESNVDSGYSVDNIRPRRPSGATGEYSARGVAIHWDEAEEEDLLAYHVYRGRQLEFDRGLVTLAAVRPDTGYFDPEGGASDRYWLAAVDVHGNESEPLAVARLDVTSTNGASSKLALFGTLPNPARPGKFAVSFSLPGAQMAEIEVLDLSGRRVLVRSVDHLGPGSHSVELGREARLGAGMYLVRLRQGGESVSRKACVIP